MDFTPSMKVGRICRSALPYFRFTVSLRARKALDLSTILAGTPIFNPQKESGDPIRGRPSVERGTAFSFYLSIVC